MRVLLKNNHLFIFGEYSLKIYEYKSSLHQSIVINCIRVTAYRNYKYFEEEIMSSLPHEYDNICELITLATLYHMNIEGGYYVPNVDIDKLIKNEVIEYA